ncbi:MAG: ribose-phosphate pyrophosphokinase-like domain-containing protein, partial [Verrucomicrobia bacterium]|nr:ribose-phosphate pyrophosphokinase-like domain-containing protein [Verrucomicrobiota bacterium]
MVKKEVDIGETGNSVLISGTSNMPFAEQVSKKIGIPLLPINICHFPDGECRVHIKGNIAGKQAIVIQSMGKKPNEYLVETLLIADALRRARA